MLVLHGCQYHNYTNLLTENNCSELAADMFIVIKLFINLRVGMGENHGTHGYLDVQLAKPYRAVYSPYP